MPIPEVCQSAGTCIDEKKRQHEVTEVNTLLHCKFLPLRRPGAGLEWPGTQPVPRPAPGAMPGVPWPRVLAGFTRMLNLCDPSHSKMSSAARKKHLKELARKKKQMREEGAGSAAAAPKGGSESNAKPLGRPPGRKDAAKRVRRTEAEQRDAAVAAGLGNALGDGPRFFCLQCPALYAASKPSREARLCVFQCNAFCLKREQKQEFVFLNTGFLSKRNIGVVGT